LPDETRLAGAVLISLTTVWLLTPVAYRLAVRTGFYDHPTGYKAHPAPTAYLGGAAVMAGFLLSVIVVGQNLSRWWPILAGAIHGSPEPSAGRRGGGGGAAVAL
jgi:UDP-N-acetylmuramyl pentapeptide phosphotransferase/UDP-N-acetylglucosamine-1-phosphate transferase